jgi:hypothetical protein
MAESPVPTYRSSRVATYTQLIVGQVLIAGEVNNIFSGSVKCFLNKIQVPKCIHIRATWWDDIQNI